MARYKPQLTEQQWTRLEPLLPKYVPSPRGGRTPKPNRDCLEGILWVLRSGARWKDIPKGFPSGPTCWRRLRDWEEQGVWQRVWRSLLKDLDAQGRLDWEEAIGDGTFSPAKKGAHASAKPSVARGRRSWSSAKGMEFLSL